MDERPTEPLSSVTVTLEPLEQDHRVVLERLWELYRHDLSEFRHGMHPGADGLFRRAVLDTVLAGDPDVAGYLVVAHDLTDHDGTPLDGPRPVGFALVGGVAEPPAHMLEFFVARSVRRQGVGFDVARQLLARHPGPWEIAFQEENPGAARFWRRLVTSVVGDAWTQESRPVPGKPTLPPDTWLSLTVPVG